MGAAGEYIWGRSLGHAGEIGTKSMELCTPYDSPIYNRSGSYISVKIREVTNM